MTNSPTKVLSSNALAGKARGEADPRVESSDPSAPLWALLPSASQLRVHVSGTAMYTRAPPDDMAENCAVALDIPRALLRPLESLPRPVSLADVKHPGRITVAAAVTQAE